MPSVWCEIQETLSIRRRLNQRVRSCDIAYLPVAAIQVKAAVTEDYRAKVSEAGKFNRPARVLHEAGIETEYLSRPGTLPFQHAMEVGWPQWAFKELKVGTEETPFEMVQPVLWQANNGPGEESRS